MKIFRWLIAVVLGVGFFWFVWPTPWEINIIGGNTWRTSRIYGCTEVRTPIGWRETANSNCKNVAQQDFSPSVDSTALEEESAPIDFGFGATKFEVPTDATESSAKPEIDLGRSTTEGAQSSPQYY